MPHTLTIWLPVDKSRATKITLCALGFTFLLTPITERVNYKVRRLYMCYCGSTNVVQIYSFAVSNDPGYEVSRNHGTIRPPLLLPLHVPK